MSSAKDFNFSRKFRYRWLIASLVGAPAFLAVLIYAGGWVWIGRPIPWWEVVSALFVGLAGASLIERAAAAEEYRRIILWLVDEIEDGIAPACAGRDEYGTPSAQVDNSTHPSLGSAVGGETPSLDETGGVGHD